jgi:hypothetical protein
VRLGLARAAKAACSVAATLIVGVTGAGVLGVGSGAVASGADPPATWKVTVGSASRTLFPGTEATMPYEVRNDTDASQHLHGTAVQLDVHSVDERCLGRWFRVAANAGPSDVDVAPGQTVNGTVTLAFDDAPVSQDACQNVNLEVVVNAS